jgi:hypothetical protein
MSEESERQQESGGRDDPPQTDPAEAPGPRENPEPDQERVEEGEEQLDRVSGN